MDLPLEVFLSPEYCATFELAAGTIGRALFLVSLPPSAVLMPKMAVSAPHLSVPVYLWMVTKAVRNTTVGLTVTRCPSFNFTTHPLLPDPSDRL
ncbi:Uncharacterised protein [Neisseria meningitidis]|nr:Uncharacterised protein [Neisseria meningitidis]